MTSLNEIEHAFRLYAICVPCNRLVELSLIDLVAAHGPETTVAWVRQHIRCRHCKRRTRDVRLVYTGNHNSAAGFHYRG